MNKTVKVIMNILLVIAGLVFFVSLIGMISSFGYANRETDDPAETQKSVFEYKLKHKAYGEILDTYYVGRLDSFDAPEGMEDIYRVAEYAHAAFMSGVYAEKGDGDRSVRNSAQMEKLKGSLGTYAYAADEIDEIIQSRSVR